MIPHVSPHDLAAALAAPGAASLAFLDVREAGEYNDAHIPRVTLLPRSQLESRLALVVPDHATAITFVDSDGQRARLAAETAAAMGYTAVAVLDGGIAAWTAAGHPTEWGSNVLSKDFGEKVQVQQQVAEVLPDELHTWLERGDNLILLDSRTPEEHARECIPGARNVPGGELPLRITDLVAENPTATVVVHCAGRTRSIIGARALQRMGIPRVFALRNGTAGWALAGYTIERGSQRTDLPTPSTAAALAADRFSRAVALEDDVRMVDVAWLQQRIARGGNLYLIDVRTQQEYEAGHVPGFQWVPGGQAVQRSEDVVGVPAGDIVFCCDATARAAVAGGWYRQMGYTEAFALEGGLTAWRAAGLAVEAGPMPVTVFGLDEARSLAPGVSAASLAEDVARSPAPVILHVGSSREYEREHVPAAIWLPRGLLEQRVRDIAPNEQQSIVCTCTDGVQSALAAATLRTLGYARATYLVDGMVGWKAAAGVVATGPERMASPANDVVRTGTERDAAAMRHYLEWEEELGRKYAQQGQ